MHCFPITPVKMNMLRNSPIVWFNQAVIAGLVVSLTMSTALPCLLFWFHRKNVSTPWTFYDRKPLLFNQAIYIR